MMRHVRGVWVGAALLGVGCFGGGLRTSDDPIRGGRPLPQAKAAGGASPILAADDPVPPPPTDGGKSPAALTAAGQPSGRDDKVSAASYDADSYEQLQQRLASHGVTRQTLRTANGRGEWHFQCSIPNRTMANIESTFETRTPSPDALSAIRAVLAEIEAFEKEK